MRAAVLREGRIVVRETPDPVPGPGELLLRTRSTAICASDVHFMDSPEMAARYGEGRIAYDPDTDIVMGHEFVGDVVALGPDCSDTFRIGERVTSLPVLLRHGGMQVIGQHPDAPGSFGELMLVPESMARAVPDGIADDAVALVDAFAVGEFYVRKSGIQPGDEIPIVIGAGAVGLSAMAALRSRGVEPLIAADFNEQRRALARSFGATITVDPAERTPYDAWRDLGAQVPPVVYECAGANGLMQRIIDECPRGSRIFGAGGWYTGDFINCTAATQKGLNIQFGGGPAPQDWYGTLDAVCSGRLDPRPSIGMVIDLEGVPEAIEMARRGDGPPRIVVHPNG